MEKSIAEFHENEERYRILWDQVDALSYSQLVAECDAEKLDIIGLTDDEMRTALFEKWVLYQETG